MTLLGRRHLTSSTSAASSCPPPQAVPGILKSNLTRLPIRHLPILPARFFATILGLPTLVRAAGCGAFRSRVSTRSTEYGSPKALPCRPDRRCAGPGPPTIQPTARHRERGKVHFRMELATPMRVWRRNSRCTAPTNEICSAILRQFGSIVVAGGMSVNNAAQSWKRPSRSLRHDVAERARRRRANRRATRWPSAASATSALRAAGRLSIMVVPASTALPRGAQLQTAIVPWENLA